MAFLNNDVLTETEARLKNPLALAFVGDSVWDLLVRQQLLHSDAHAGALHKKASSAVNAAAQAQAARTLEAHLTDNEQSVYRRGCNAHAHHNPPKNQSPRDYSLASGLEALFGYLYLTAQYERMLTLYQIAEKAAESPQQTAYEGMCNNA